MNIDKFLKFFVPKDHSFFPLFEKGSRNLLEASELFKSLMVVVENEKRESIIKQIKELELAGDNITQEILDQLDKSFITPFDREDIHKLASNVDNVLDTLNGLSRRILLYNPIILRPVYSDMAEIINMAAREILVSILGLKEAGNNRAKIRQACNTINDLERKGDDLYFTALSHLFNEVKDLIELTKSKEIIESLENCIDETEDVSDTIKSILIKMS